MKWLIAAAVLASAAWSQPVAFEVASVKFTAHGRTADGWSHSSVSITSPGTFTATNGSLEELIRWAYQVKKYQISGPAWLNDDAECFDVAAKTSPEMKDLQIRQMVQTLLAERFKLALHRETRTLPIYDLLVAKNGPKLMVAKPDANQGSTSSRGGTEGVTMTSPSLSMQSFADFLGRQLDRPVYDRTGIQGNYEIAVEYGRENDIS